MEWQDLLADGYGRVLEFMESMLKGLTQDDLKWQPRNDCNSIGWISCLGWHPWSFIGCSIVELEEDRVSCLGRRYRVCCRIAYTMGTTWIDPD